MMEGGDWYLNVLKEDVLKAAKAWLMNSLGSIRPVSREEKDLANAVTELMDFEEGGG
jgi:hypothetical protein